LFYYDKRLFISKIVVTPVFRANFVNIENNYLIVEKYSSIANKLHDGLWSMPLQWIIDIKTLDDIFLRKPLLPLELMMEIDNFIL
jgi:hypothetical protein